MLPSDGAPVEAEVVGFAGERLLLMPTGDMHGLRAERARDPARSRRTRSPVGPRLLGRVIDGAGQPLDGLGPHRVPTAACG